MNVNHKRTILPEGFEWGVYAWKMPDGKVLGDAEGNVLNVPSMKGDIQKMGAIRAFVTMELGIEGGEPFFMEGVERLTEAEHAGQMEQLLDGKIPDRDYRTMIGHLKQQRRRERQGG